MVVLELEVLVEDGRVKLDFAVELVAKLLPVGRGLRHVMRPWKSCKRWRVAVALSLELEVIHRGPCAVAAD